MEGRLRVFYFHFINEEADLFPFECEKNHICSPAIITAISFKAGLL